VQINRIAANYSVIEQIMTEVRHVRDLVPTPDP
jgi:hypothetical protein